MSASPAARPSWRDDAVAASIITLLLIPQSLAYALLAGLPAELGLAASIVPAMAYAAVGTSPFSVMGPGAVLSLMTAQGLHHALAVAPAGTPVVALAGVLALEIGAVLALGALLRLDALVALLSVPVLHGFMTGASLTIVITQLPVLLGSSSSGNGLATVLQGWLGASQVVNPPTLAVGAGTLGLLWLSRRPGLPRLLGRLAPLLAMALAIGAALLWPLADQGVRTVGTLPPLAIRASLPLLDLQLWRLLLPTASMIALLASVEHLAVVSSLAARCRQHIVPRRELAGLGASNIVAALTGGMPVGGGLSRSAVAYDAGARSKRVGVMVGLMMALSAVVLAEPLAHLPRAVLAATILVAASSMLDLGPFRLAWRFAHAEFWVMLGVAALTLLASMEVALSVGVALSAALLLQRTADPHVARIGRVPGTEHYRNIERHTAEEQPGVVALRIDESLLFTNARELGSLVQDQLDEDTRRVVLQMSPVNTIDFSGLTALLALDEALHARGVRLDLAEVKGPVMDRLASADWSHRVHGKVYLSLHQALQPTESLSPR
ncbi:STAS domain-containing protein [Ideonella sp. 4Y11]|uniref:STAS domain-containing protein n=1 Tax=Ideonella aquatica TaxID=2824119 RepID=A0A940YIS7_9BURK|nr:SulP family inorganic anion transporter [Ideonella aquatica]MBQ0958624.1 STAS domain-containing protein [Ideonella aquatica]